MFDAYQTVDSPQIDAVVAIAGKKEIKHTTLPWEAYIETDMEERGLKITE